MDTLLPRTLLGVEDLLPGDFACAIFSDAAGRAASVRPFLAAGLRNHEKILFLFDGDFGEEMARLVTEAGPEAIAAQARGQIAILPAQVICPPDAPPDIPALVERVAGAIAAALAEGYTALRICGESSWVLRAPEGVGLLAEIEARLAELFSRRPALGLNLFDRNLFTGEQLMDRLRGHPLVVLGADAHWSPCWVTGGPPEDPGRGQLELDHWLRHLRDRRALLVALKISERRFRQLFESLVFGFAVHQVVRDAEGRPHDYRFLDVNPAFEALTGLEASAILGRRVLEVLPDLEPVWLDRYFRVVETGEEVRFRQFSAALQRHYEVVAYRPAPEQFATVFTDITEIVRAEERRIEAERRLFESQKLDSLGLLAGGIAHDFNNMLMGVLGNASLALDDAPQGSPLEECLQDIESAAKSAAGLARQLLAYSGRGRFIVEPVDLRVVVREMGKLLEASIPKNVRIRYHLADDVGAIHADLSQIRQVLMNLILNAAQAIGERSGIISVAISAMDCDAEYLGTTFTGDGLEPGRYVYLEITDTGVGMEPETQKRIFDPFFTTKQGGRGLGLAATLGIVRGHRGAVKVYSELGRGTTFKVLLPECGSQIAQANERDVEGGEFVPRGTVLVVDDEEPVRRVAGRILRRMGFDVLSAEDGREAVAIFQSHPDGIVLVLLDMMMPRMGGERTFTELRRIRPDVRVVLTSGYNEQEAVDRFVGRGLAGFIQKPYQKSELERVVREALG
ncbi:MAG: MEDS domain-containing protein [Pseudomonadota bacterium]